MIFVITGPSGVGKSFLVEYLRTEHPDKFTVVKVVTTRPPRANEQAQDRLHVGDLEFNKLIATDKFLIHGKYGGNNYGWLAQDFNKNKMMLTNVWPGILEDFVAVCDAIPIYLQAESDFLRIRMAARGDSTEKIAQRIKIAEADDVLMENLPRLIRLHGKLFKIDSDQVIPEIVHPWVMNKIGK